LFLLPSGLLQSGFYFAENIMAAAAASAALDPSNSTKNTLKLENVRLPLPLHLLLDFFW
jgi:hypothetical protein